MRLKPRSAAAPCSSGAAAPACESLASRATRDLRTGLVAGGVTLALMAPSGAPPSADVNQLAASTAALVVGSLRSADLKGTATSDPVRRIANWSAATQDHAGKPFVVIDKQAAQLYVFDGAARLQAHTAVLLGLAPGDHTVPGIGNKPMADVLPEERTTPAGRFNGQLGRNLTGEDVVWVDYDAAVSMHRVRAHKSAERRLQRLASVTAQDNRISYGCINVPAAFFDAHLLPMYTAQMAKVYVLPDHLSLEQVFGPVP